tara:strand:+ start:2446 stop:2754 length:309 start_codon:yes stop_codon:yes gene_type:complete
VNKLFQRKIEDFVCDYCHAHVSGNGYTNHCSHCLWSKHVDVYPGDRAAECGELMKPIEVLQTGGSYILLHECIRCHYVKKNKLARDDNTEAVIALVQEIANK